MIATDRLVLRRWRDTDAAPYHAMGRDREVMRHLGPLMNRHDADAMVGAVNAQIDRLGHAFWAVERRSDRRFIGYCGIKRGPRDTPIENEFEIAWGLAHDTWGQGYAREAAEAALMWGWANMDVARFLAFTTRGNERSWGLMLRLGMTRLAGGDFDHPALSPGDPLRPHITYELRRQ